MRFTLFISTGIDEITLRFFNSTDKEKQSMNFVYASTELHSRIYDDKVSTTTYEDKCRQTDNENKQRVLFAMRSALWLVDLRSLRYEICIWMGLHQIAMILKYIYECKREINDGLHLLCKVEHLQCSLQQHFWVFT